MTIGIAAAVYFSWLGPRIARKRLRKQAEAEKAAVLASGSPNMPYSPYTDNHCLVTPYMGNDDSLEKNSPIFVKDDADAVLSPPAPAYMSEKKARFSTSTHDGIWWVV